MKVFKAAVVKTTKISELAMAKIRITEDGGVKKSAFNDAILSGEVSYFNFCMKITIQNLAINHANTIYQTLPKRTINEYAVFKVNVL